VREEKYYDMEPQSLTLGVIIIALAVLFVFWPFVSRRSRDEDEVSTQVESLIIQRDAIYTTIRDLDFDYETGKVTEEDYHAQRETWVQRGIAVLKALDAWQEEGAFVPAPSSANGHLGGTQPDADRTRSADLDDQIEAAVRARRAG
jgi:hypothetical protein